MTQLLPPGTTASVALVRRWPSLPEVLVVGGAVLAPLNLVIVRSLTVYDVLLALAFVILLLRRELRMADRGYVIAFLVFVIAALLSTFRATYAIESLTQIMQYVFIGFVQVPVVLSVVRTRNQALLSILLICAGTLGAIMHSYVTQQTQGAGRVLVFYSENPNRLGYPVVYLLPLLFVLWQNRRRFGPWLRHATTLLGLASVTLCVWALFASASRSSLLGTLVSLTVFVVFRPRGGVFRLLARGVALALALTALWFALTTSGTLPTTLEERIDRSMSTDPQDRVDLLGDRTNLAQAAMRAFVASPYLGTGLDNFRYVTTNYDLDATPQVPHNLWLQLMVQVGAVGTAAFAAILVLWFRDVLRAYRRAATEDQAVLWALASSMCGVLTIVMFSPEMLLRHYWLMLALGMAVVAGATHGTRTGEAR